MLLDDVMFFSVTGASSATTQWDGKTVLVHGLDLHTSSDTRKSVVERSGWSSGTCVLVTTKGDSRIPADDLKAYLKKVVGASVHVTVKDTDKDEETFVHIDSQEGRFYKYA